MISQIPGEKPGENSSSQPGVAALIGLAAVGMAVRSSRKHSLQPQSNETFETTVTVVHPGKVWRAIPVLPGQTQAFTDAPIFAQTSGYLKQWRFDIGTEVKAGDVLAEIDTPEVDQELAQAQAQIKVAQSALDPGGSNLPAESGPFKRKVIAEEDFDIAVDTYRENQATVMADQANIKYDFRRSKHSKSFGRHSTVLSPLEILTSEITSLRARVLSSFASSRFLRYGFMSTCLRVLPI